MKSFKSIAVLLSIALMTFGLVGCGEKKEDDISNSKIETVTKYPLTIKDSNDNEVVIDSEPKKIVSLAPNITEILFALGKGDILAGRTEYCNYPEEALKVQNIGTIFYPDLELIAEINPDLVIASTHFAEAEQAKIDELGIKTIILSSEESFEGVYKLIETIGQILNVYPKAEEVVGGMKEKISEVTKKVEGLEAPSMYYVVDFGEFDSTAGGDTFIGEMIRMANGKNIADDTKGWLYSKEKIAEKNPEIVVLSNKFNMKDRFTSTDFYKDLEAVKKGMVYEIDENLLDREGPRIADGLEALAKILHPEAFK